MRRMATTLAVMTALGMSPPVLAEQHMDKGMTQTQMQGQMGTEVHLKAAGYDVMQANTAIQARDQKMAKQHMMSAREHIKHAETMVGGGTMATDIRKIGQSIDRAETTVARDMAGAKQELARINTDLSRIIQQARQGAGAKQPGTPQNR